MNSRHPFYISRHPFLYKVIAGEFQFNLKNYEKAVDLFKQALNRNPEVQEPRDLVGGQLCTYSEEEFAWWKV